MKKEEIIKRYGKAAYEKMLQQTRDWNKQHINEKKVIAKKWRECNPDKVKAHNQEGNRKGGKYYEKQLEYKTIGFQGERNHIRATHNYQYRAIKQATPNSVLHDEWIPGTAKYRGLALVEKVPHQNGIIKVIKVLEGQITAFTEKEIREQVVCNANTNKRV